MFNKTDAMIKAAAIAKAKEEIADFTASADAAAEAGVQYAVDFFRGLIADRSAKIDWLRTHLVHPGC